MRVISDQSSPGGDYDSIRRVDAGQGCGPGFNFTDDSSGEMRPLGSRGEEQADIVAFLEALTGEASAEMSSPPRLPEVTSSIRIFSPLRWRRPAFWMSAAVAADSPWLSVRRVPA